MKNKVMREGNMVRTLRGEAYTYSRSVITRKPPNPAEGNLFEAIAATRRPLATNQRVDYLRQASRNLSKLNLDEIDAVKRNLSKLNLDEIDAVRKKLSSPREKTLLDELTELIENCFPARPLHDVNIA